jgi:anthranilate synthase component 1
MISLALQQPPDLMAIHAFNPKMFPCLLLSAGAGATAQTAGWDILFALPDTLPETMRVYQAHEGDQFWADLAALPMVNANDAPTTPDSIDFPFKGGWFVYAGYELQNTLEPSVPKGLEHNFPLACLARSPAAVLFHHPSQTAYLVAETPQQLAVLQQSLAQVPPFNPQKVGLTHLEEDPPEWYLNAIAQLKRYIYEGDVFQVNISRAWQASLTPDIKAIDIFHAARQHNPAPFSALLDMGEAQIISASPERLVQVKSGWVSTRPIAGTHPRARDDANADALLRQQLAQSTKERAEHIMLVDLARNDIGRLAEWGTVEVNELMTVASYAFVHHIESNIRGKLRPNTHPAEVLAAVFPCGTITGCPKVRTMQIIRELEKQARRAYTGSLGYINHDGSMDFNVLIRTFMQQKTQLYFRAGGGIVADSDSNKELQETRHKAHGLLKTLGVTL